MSDSTFDTAAYGGAGWSARTRSLGEELGSVWAECGIDSEWRTLRAVVLHRPGEELAGSVEPDAVQMLDTLDPARAGAEHDALAQCLHHHGVAVHRVEPAGPARPNQMFCADLMFATPEGVILARPASTVRAGEERQLARRLADVGVPIVRSVGGAGTFEGADAMWLAPRTVVVGVGLRTNEAGARQVGAALAEQGVETLVVDMPYGTMHLMGLLRCLDAELWLAWPRRTPHRVVEWLRARGHTVAFLPEGDEQRMNQALNVVTLGPRRVLMKAGCGAWQAFLESLGVGGRGLAADELVKAAGGFGCLTGVLQRERGTERPA